MQKRAILLEAVSTGVQAAELRQSLPEQDARLNDIAEREKWDIVDIIVIPGFSRVFYTYREFSEAALSEGISSPIRMFDHWLKRDFDVLAVMTGDRFGREQSIFAEVVTRTIDTGAQVFTVRDGYIHKQNYRMYISMGGYSASAEIDELKRRRKFGMSKRAKRGLPLSPYGHIPSHTLVGSGDTARTVVNEDKRRLFTDIAELLLARKSYRQITTLLAERGHFRKDGRPIPQSTLRDWLMHPTLWGNTAQDFQSSGKFSVGRGYWVFDPDEPPPDYVTMHYNTHPPMYEGELAERVKAEMRRRFNGSRAHPLPQRMFTGLVVCNRCHYSASYIEVRGWKGVRCSSRLAAGLKEELDCPNLRSVNEKKLITAARDMLDDLAASQDWALLFGPTESVDVEARLLAIDREVQTLKAKAQRLYDERADVPLRFREQFNESVAKLDQQGEALELEAARLKLVRANTQPSADQHAALTEYAANPDTFWQKDGGEINQLLARIMGKRRFVIDDGEVIGTTAQPKRNKHTPRSRTLG